MKLKTVKLDSVTRAVLLRSNIDGCNLTLPEQLPRQDYERVAKAIEAAGGKWNRKAKCHVFPHPVRETLDISEDTVSVTDVQQTYQSFYTPAAVADQMARLCDIRKGHNLLEPSAGEGALLLAAARAGAEKWSMVAVEIDEHKRLILDALCGMLFVHDFIAIEQVNGLKFDRILMNPPFSGGADCAHIRHAIRFLAPGGKLVALCGNGPKQEAQLRPLATHWEPLPAGAFRESGTNVNIAMMLIEA